MNHCIPQTQRHCVFTFVVSFDLVLAGSDNLSVILLPETDGVRVGRDCTLEDRLKTRRLTNASVLQVDFWSDC